MEPHTNEYSERVTMILRFSIYFLILVYRFRSAKIMYNEKRSG